MTTYTNDLVLPDEDFALDPDQAPLAGKGTPLPPGVYEVVVTGFQPQRLDRAGNPVEKKASNGRSYISAKLDSFKVVGPFPYDGKKVFTFQDIGTQPIPRAGKFTTELYDLLLAYDQRSEVSGIEAGRALAMSYVESQKPIRVRTTLEALDMAYVQQHEGKEMTKDERNAMWKAARLKVANFTSPTGQILSSVIGPSGQTVEARVKITVFYPSDFVAKLGADHEKS